MTEFPVSGAILAGGRSARMGRDKAFLPHPLDGQPLIARQAALLREIGCDDLIISGRAGIDYAVPDARVFTDLVADSGPLAGLAQILAAARHPWVLVVAVDMPHLTASYLQQLLTAGSGRIGVVPLGPQGYEPLVALYPRALLPVIEAALVAQRLSLQSLLQVEVTNGRFQSLPIADDDRLVFTNWNTLADTQG
jgi:molybdopterin-guanine dinucleotide biosynthesis protein A